MEDFNNLYKIHSQELYNYLYYLTGNYSLANELLQETFYQAFLSIHRFKGKSTVKTWLYKIAKHVYYKDLAKVKRENKVNIDEVAESEFISSHTPEKIIELKERDDMLIDSLSQLKEPYKQIIILRCYSCLSFKEIGDIHSKGESWARVTFHRGKLQLLKIMKGENFNE
ncbi:RNA polymerase sigma factor [Cytobacillus pseudoceanisediminis]|uniref:RNA polymerase sigma factor n=1 Tax=Cytobacillus pseudoceanisediminis TaxID=3051614 RepID=UPI003C2AE722